MPIWPNEVSSLVSLVVRGSHVGWEHDAPHQRSNTLLQHSRSSVFEVRLAPHGRAIHYGTKRRFHVSALSSATEGKADMRKLSIGPVVGCHPLRVQDAGSDAKIQTIRLGLSASATDASAKAAAAIGNSRRLDRSGPADDHDGLAAVTRRLGTRSSLARGSELPTSCNRAKQPCTFGVLDFAL